MTEAEQDNTEDIFERWVYAKRALDHTLDEYMAERGSTAELFLRVAELRRSEEIAWAALQRATDI